MARQWDIEKPKKITPRQAEDIQTAVEVSEKVLTTDNSKTYNPTDDYHPATKKYVDDQIAANDCPEYKYVQAASQAEGDLHLSDAGNWATSLSIIKTVRVETTSSDWDLWLLQNDNGYSTNDANIPRIQLMDAGNGDKDISVDMPYEDEDASDEVHLYVIDNSGTETFDLTVTGYGLK